MLSEDNQLLYTLDPVSWVYTTTVNSLLQLSAFLSVTPEACFETYRILATIHFISTLRLIYIPESVTY